MKPYDIVNMRVAKYLHAPVLLVADVDRGGSLAALVGTLALLEEDERDLVKGLIVNKFRGDVSLFAPAVDFLEKKTGKPVLGVIPYIENLNIDDEDSVSLEDKPADRQEGDLDIAVIRLPKISNFTDFDSLQGEGDVSLRYVREAADLGRPDVVILPGSKNTIEDMAWLQDSGMASSLYQVLSAGAPVVGICGGYQMLGRYIYDPEHTESSTEGIGGLDLLPIETTFTAGKTLAQVKGECCGLPFLGQVLSAEGLEGYEIHMGHTADTEAGLLHPIVVTERSQQACHVVHGTARRDGLVWGTYMHGIFDNDAFRRDFLNCLRRQKGLQPLAVRRNFRAEKQKSYDRLAAVVRAHLDMDTLRRIMAGRD